MGGGVGRGTRAVRSKVQNEVKKDLVGLQIFEVKSYSKKHHPHSLVILLEVVFIGSQNH